MYVPYGRTILVLRDVSVDKWSRKIKTFLEDRQLIPLIIFADWGISALRVYIENLFSLLIELVFLSSTSTGTATFLVTSQRADCYF
jgi:hypothetical protein